MSSEIVIKHGHGHYPVIVGSGLLGELGREVMSRFNPAKVAIVTDNTVARLYLKQVEASFEGVVGTTIQVPPGEKSKSWKILDRVSTGLLEAGLTRTDLVVALGGGVIGDLAGMAASLVKRGVPLVHAPTTLLAQADASVGGKTAINTKFGKNTLGTFYPPKLVVSDVEALKTQSDRDYWSGYAEVVKHAILAGENAIAALEGQAAGIYAREAEVMEDVVARSVRIKGGIVGRDETDQEERMLLNLGHSFAHAIEAIKGFGKIRHGEAVSIGICMALMLAGSKERARIAALLENAELPTTLEAAGIRTTAKEMKRHMLGDKKNTGEAFRLVVALAPGFVKVEDVDPETLDRFLETVTF